MLTTTNYLITNLKNATRANLDFTFIPYSRKNLTILNYFLKYKLIRGFLVYQTKHKILVITEPLNLTYVLNLKMYSTSSLRRYVSLKELAILAEHCYFGLITTTSGLMSFAEALFHKKGGEVLFLTKAYIK